MSESMFRYMIKKRSVAMCTDSFDDDSEYGSLKKQKIYHEHETSDVEPLDHLFDTLHHHGLKLVYKNGVGYPVDLFIWNDMAHYRPNDEIDVRRILGEIDWNGCKFVNQEYKDLSDDDVLSILGIWGDISERKSLVEKKAGKTNSSTTSVSEVIQITGNVVCKDPPCVENINKTGDSPTINKEDNNMSIPKHTLLTHDEDAVSSIHSKTNDENHSTSSCLTTIVSTTPSAPPPIVQLYGSTSLHHLNSCSCSTALVSSSTSLPSPVQLHDHNAFLSLSGENRYWNEMMQRFYQLSPEEGKDIHGIQERDPELATWIRKQKVECEKEWISTDKLNVLLKAGFQYEQSDESTRTWKQNLVLLFDFYQTHGHTRVPSHGELGQWVERQRFKGYHGRLKPKRYLRLQALNFEFDPNYFLRPLLTKNITMVQYHTGTVGSQNSYTRPKNTTRFHIPRIGLSTVGYALLISLLMVDLYFLVAVGVGIHMGRLILQRELDGLGNE